MNLSRSSHENEFGGRVMFWKAYLLLLAAMGLLDGIFLGFLARPFYIKHIGSMMRDMVYWPSALAFYFAYAAGATFFVILPSLEEGTLRGILAGAFFGFIAYMTYDFTNHATLKGFPFIVVLFDVAWGTMATAVSCGFVVRVMRSLQ